MAATRTRLSDDIGEPRVPVSAAGCHGSRNRVITILVTFAQIWVAAVPAGPLAARNHREILLSYGTVLERPPGMALTVFGLLIVLGVVFKVMTGDERTATAQRVLTFVKELKHEARRRPDEDVFYDALKQQSAWAIVTPVLVGLNIVIFVFMLFGSGTLSDSKTIVDWGGSIGPRTTNGEWWRVVTSMFVHAGLFQLLVTAGALLQVGLLIERLVGRAAFSAAYFTAGIFAGLVNLSAHRAAVGFGASGAVFGIYGLLIAFSIWSRFHPSGLTIPTTAAKRLVPVTALFLLYSMVTGSLSGAAELTGLAAGFICGLVATMGTTDPRPSTRRLAGVVAGALVITVVAAIPLHGIADVRPELDRMVELENQSTKAFQAADVKFKKRQMTADALAALIDRTILPELKASQDRLQAIRKVPTEHGPILTDAKEYLRLRSESWRLRADGLRKIELRALQTKREQEPIADASWRRSAEAQHRANLATIGNAEGKTHAALLVLDRIKTAKSALP